jgi:hypothetical protein
VARFRNEFRQLTCRRLTEKGVVDEVMGDLKRNPVLRGLIEEAEANKRGVGKTEGTK